jgi:hypothetical protein
MAVFPKQSESNIGERDISKSYLRWCFGFFVVSGFCGLVYEVVWLRLAMASYGVTTALASIVISMFMAGLGLGSWGAGVLTRRVLAADGRRALRFYSIAELLVGISSLAVPLELTPALATHGQLWSLAILTLLHHCGYFRCHYTCALVYLYGLDIPSVDGGHSANCSANIGAFFQLLVHCQRSWRASRHSCLSIHIN